MEHQDDLKNAWKKFKNAFEKSRLVNDGKIMNCEVVFRHGKFYDKSTGKRVILREGAIFSVEYNLDDTLTEDPYNKPMEKVAPEETLERLEKKKYHSHKRLRFATTK